MLGGKEDREEQDRKSIKEMGFKGKRGFPETSRQETCCKAVSCVAIRGTKSTIRGQAKGVGLITFSRKKIMRPGAPTCLDRGGGGGGATAGRQESSFPIVRMNWRDL